MTTATGTGVSATGKLVRRILASIVALAGFVDIISALSRPIHSRMEAVDAVLPLAVPQVANVAVVASGVLLVFLAGQLARGKRRAWQIAVILLIASVILHVVKALDVEEASVAGALAIALLLTRRLFAAASDAPSFRRLLRLGPLLAVAPLAYGLAGLWLRPNSVGGWPGLPTAISEVGYRLVGLAGPLHYQGGFGKWFPGSITAVGAIAAVWILSLAFRPVAMRTPHPSEDLERRVRRLVEGCDDSLAYFQLRDDKSLFEVDGGQAVIAYRTVGGVALVGGDPLGSVERWPNLLDAFVRYAHEHGWRVAAMGTTERAANVWETLGFRTLYIGDEAVIDTTTFNLEGSRMRRARQEFTRVGRLGYAVEWYRSADIPPDLQRALLHISERWRGEDEERGFSMTLGRLFDPRDPDCLVAVARDEHGFARGFLHFTPVGPPDAPHSYSLDVMRRDRDANSGLNDYLIVRTIEHCREIGVGRLSLNFAFLRGIIRPSGRLRPMQRFQQWLAFRLGPWFQIESLYHFNSKYRPEWVPRYAVYEGRMSIPAVLLAALRAEKLLDRSLLTRQKTRTAQLRASAARSALVGAPDLNEPPAS